MAGAPSRCYRLLRTSLRHSGRTDLNALFRALQELLKAEEGCVAPISQRALPHYCHAPSSILQRCKSKTISPNVRLNLLTPEVRSRCWEPKEAASSMAVPEASVNENDGLSLP